jgi:Cyclophilin type peptidyl-prolyl cis-trans isomerase/CLD
MHMFHRATGKGLSGGDGKKIQELRKSPTQSSLSLKSSSSSMVSKIVIFLLVGIIFYRDKEMRNELKLKTEHSEDLMKRGITLEKEMDDLKVQLNAASQEVSNAEQNEVGDLPTDAEENDTEENDNKNSNEELINQLHDYKKRMHSEIQRISKRELIAKYGMGPYQLDIIVEYDPESNIYDSNSNSEGGTIRIELASINDMPATVYHFLEQVSLKLFNGCSFHRNADHVLQAGATSNFKSPTKNEDEFKEAQLYSVPFQE